MTLFPDLDKTSAAQIYAVANTPSFLVRRLKTDPLVAEIQARETNAISAELRRALSKTPKSLADFVAPYVYLVALSGKRNPAVLAEVAGYPAHYHEWYRAACALLLVAARVDTIRNLHIPSPTRSVIPGPPQAIPTCVQEINLGPRT